MFALVIRNCTVIDGWGGDARPGQAVLVERGRIASVVPDHAAPAGDQLVSIDGQGHFLLPGLINCHVHVCNDGALDQRRQVLDDSLPIASLRSVANLATALRAGITTVRDCGSVDGIAIEIARAVAAGLVAGPRILAAGRVITKTGGHGYYIGSEADGADDVRRATRRELKSGASFIKAIATGGVLTPGSVPEDVGLDFDELSALVREAHNAGARCAAHAIGRTGIKNALRAGIDSIEHAVHLDSDALELALAQGTVLVPTLRALERIIAHSDDPHLPEYIAEKARREVDAHRSAFAAALASGALIAAGTDAGTPYNYHGDLSRELALMVELGMSPMQAIVAATSTAAQTLGLADCIGSVEPGKIADLILVARDPTHDISALNDVELVIQAGDVVCTASSTA